MAGSVRGNFQRDAERVQGARPGIGRGQVVERHQRAARRQRGEQRVGPAAQLGAVPARLEAFELQEVGGRGPHRAGVEPFPAQRDARAAEFGRNAPFHGGHHPRGRQAGAQHRLQAADFGELRAHVGHPALARGQRGFALAQAVGVAPGVHQRVAGVVPDHPRGDRAQEESDQEEGRRGARAGGTRGLAGLEVVGKEERHRARRNEVWKPPRPAARCADRPRCRRQACRRPSGSGWVRPAG